MEKIKAVFAWSGGKDSAYALHQVLKEGKYDIKYLLTTLNKEFKRVSMHGVKEELLDLQVNFQIGEKVYKPLEEKYLENKPDSTKGFWFVELDSLLH